MKSCFAIISIFLLSALSAVTYEGHSASIVQHDFGRGPPVTSWSAMLEPFTFTMQSNRVTSITSWPSIWGVNGAFHSKNHYMVTGKESPWFWYASTTVLKSLRESESYRYLTLAKWTPPRRNFSDNEFTSFLYVKGYIYAAEPLYKIKKIPEYFQNAFEPIDYDGLFIGTSVLNGKVQDVRGVLSVTLCLVDGSTHFSLFIQDYEPIDLILPLKEDCSLKSYGTPPHHLRANFYGSLLEEIGGTFTTTTENETKITGVFALKKLSRN